MKKLLFFLFTAFMPFIKAQEIQGVFNYGIIGDQFKISVNRLLPESNPRKIIENQRKNIEKFNQKHPNSKKQFNEQALAYYLRTFHRGFYAGYNRVDYHQSDLYLGYMFRWGYGIWKVEPFFGIQTDVLRKQKGYDLYVPFSFAYMAGLDLNLSKKIALNCNVSYKVLDFDEYNYGNILNISLGLRYSIINNLKR